MNLFSIFILNVVVVVVSLFMFWTFMISIYICLFSCYNSA